MRKLRFLLIVLSAGLLLSGCGASITNYARPQTAWDTIARAAVLPIETPSENLIRRQQITQLFATELRRIELEDVIEVHSTSPLGILPNTEEVGQVYSVDAVFSGSVDESEGLSIQIKLHDVATGELIWSTSYLSKSGLGLFSSKTPRQRLQRAFRQIAQHFRRQRSHS
jgi:TolB-like protein